MNIKKKFSITFFSLIFIFILLYVFGMQDVYAVEKEITYNGITTTMPEIIENDDSEDPEKPKSSNSKLKSNLAIVQPVGATYGMQISVSDLINNYESEDAYVGIDVSKWQGNIDWKAVKDSGVKYVMIRCGFRGYGSNGTIVQDEYFNANMKGALENGLYVGVYFFSTAITEEEAIQEAAFVLECCKEYDVKYPIVYDFEYFGEHFDAESGNPYRTNGLTSEQINKNAKAFLRYIRSNSSYKTMLYGSEHYLNTIWNVDSFTSQNDIWLAHYPSMITGNKTSYNGTYQMWQCTDAGQVPGINTLVDLNFDYKYYEFLEKKDSFLDVKKDMWFYEPVEYCKENEIILGYGETREYFKPNEKITRGMFVTILHRMAGSPTVDASLAKNFPDVQDSEYYAEAVKWASSVGVVNGFGDGTFGPNKSILRQDLVVMFRNYVEKVLGKDVSVVDDKCLLNFEDYHKIESYAFEFVQWAVENKVITGKEGKYIDPLGTATRAETASIIHKYIINSEKDVYDNGFKVKGKLNISKINLDCNILEETTEASLAVAPGILTISKCDSILNTVEDLNVSGTNAVIMGHNYKNGEDFSNLKDLAVGDNISLTDSSGNTVQYTIYQTYYTDTTDVSHIERELDINTREITLVTSSDDGSQRLIILAKDK